MPRKAMNADEADIARKIEDIQADAKVRQASPIIPPESIHEDPEPWQVLGWSNWGGWRYLIILCVLAIVVLWVLA